MCPSGLLSTWLLLLTLHMSACDLEVCGSDSPEVICSQGLSNCTMEEETFLTVEENNSVDIQNLTPYFKLCCKEAASCSLCLMIDTEINIHVEVMEDEGHSGRASVSVCYYTAQTMPTCKRVEFTVKHTALTQAKVSMLITEPAGVTFSSEVIIYSVKSSHVKVAAPSLDEVCSMELHEHVEECQVPKILSVISKERNQVELHFAGRNESLPSVCVQYEQNGTCRSLERLTIPLYSVTTCMCFQAWDEDDQRPRRSRNCPFRNTKLFHRNIWENVSVSVGEGLMSNSRSMLTWNVSAPCRLEGEVWPCQRDISCKEVRGYRQQLAKSTWTQNSKGLWEKRGVFEDMDLQLSPCVMVKVDLGVPRELGPFCFKNTDRWRWSVLVFGAMLIICLTIIMVYLLHGFIKKWVWSWHSGGFVKVGRMCHVVLLSPPDVDAGVSESVCQLGSLLSNHGFSVSVDQWSRKEQCTLGPLPWLHSQLLELKSQRGRAVLILNQKALERAEEWTRWYKKDMKTKMDSKGLPQRWSPYSDVFSALLFIIQTDKEQGRAGERFLLVKFDSYQSSNKGLPELFQGLPLFHLPSKTRAFLSELTVGGTERGAGRRT
ncbi:interleukin-17 receptor C isoform X2 [Cheilinus undulatus]|uniref:interleukin-17 receptor C isoform X2 n=1 Tax=Cheilinus undulatus TaxID=241271 RepID=UPI001BD36139|nr:interleukin-17 receptor C isoform X2 [Cheilinus undulatus]